MIFGNVGNLKEFSFLEDSVKKCFEYLESHKLLFFEKGSYEIDGDRLFVNVAEYETTAPENRFWEAHKDYLDVHVMLRGEEQIDVNFIGNMHLEEYVKSRHKEGSASFEREDLADGTVIYHVNTSGILQRYTFTEI